MPKKSKTERLKAAFVHGVGSMPFSGRHYMTYSYREAVRAVRAGNEADFYGHDGAIARRMKENGSIAIIAGATLALMGPTVETPTAATATIKAFELGVMACALVGHGASAVAEGIMRRRLYDMNWGSAPAPGPQQPEQPTDQQPAPATVDLPLPESQDAEVEPLLQPQRLYPRPSVLERSLDITAILTFLGSSATAIYQLTQ